MVEMWKSKLGNEYPKADILRDENKHKEKLDHLRRLPENRNCADCGQNGTVWASVNLGVFLCMKCGAHHRGMGTHVSLPKGCTGSYLWGPDEIEQMERTGNGKAALIYGGGDHRPNATAPDSEWFQFIVDKYEHGKFKPKAKNPPLFVQSPGTSTTRKSLSSPTSPGRSLRQQPLLDWEHFEQEVHSSPVATTKSSFSNSHGKLVIPDMLQFHHHNNATGGAESRQEASPVKSSPKPKVNPERNGIPKETTGGTGDNFFASFGL